MENMLTTSKDFESAIKDWFSYIGEDADIEGLAETPKRVARMWNEILRGYDPAQRPKITTFKNEEGFEGIIIDKGQFFSLCEHHILPFFGRYWFGYIPSKEGRVLGISKVARVVSFCSAKLQLQERLTKEIVTMLEEALGESKGMILKMQGLHLCKAMRGAKSNGEMVTVYYTGEFNDPEKRKEFLSLCDEE